MTTGTLLSWVFLSLCTLGCIASFDSARASGTNKGHLSDLANLLAGSIHGSGRAKRETSAPVKEFFDEYYAAKTKEDLVPMWNLLPINFAWKDLRADTIKVLQSTTTDEKALSNKATAVHQFSFDDVEAGKTEIVAAQLRMKVPAAHSSKGILFAYQLLEPANVNRTTARKLLAFWRIGGSTDTSSIVLDVTSLAKEWLHSSLLNNGIQLEFQSEIGVAESTVLPTSPLLVLYMNNHDNLQHTVDESRQRRHAPSKRQVDLSEIDAQEPTPAPSGTPPCGVSSLIVTKEEMGLGDVIFSPSRITFSYCDGHCHWPFPQNVNATNSGRIQGRVAVLTQRVPEPCCAPREYQEETYIFYDGNSIKAQPLTEAKVVSCECK